MAVKEFVLDGSNMVSVDGFYDEVQRVLCPDFSGFGRNLDALNDILRGGFGTFEYGDQIRIRIVNVHKMRMNLEASFFRHVMEVLEESENVELSLE
ncbi:MAG: barstar family protein [Candidatus Thorarchaeota archaeon]|nr:barstar family protein [Candidatus Thorarchaeota archaeon]